MRASVLQLNSSDDPVANLAVLRAGLREAASAGADMVFTPEVSNCVSASRTHQASVLTHQDNDLTLAALRTDAKALGLWVSIGSLALKSDDPEGRFVNRSFLIDPNGAIAAWYDKIHMFDVTVSETETYRESAGYRPGERAVVVDTPLARMGLTICYDVRFPHLYRQLAHAGAQVITVPSAFSPVTGAAHWEVLLRARAIECGCFVIAAAQTGTHQAGRGRQRSTYGHSLIVAPWGEVLSDAGTEPGLITVDLDMAQVAQARSRIPALLHDRDIKL